MRGRDGRSVSMCTPWGTFGPNVQRGPRLRTLLRASSPESRPLLRDGNGPAQSLERRHQVEARWARRRVGAPQVERAAAWHGRYTGDHVLQDTLDIAGRQ